MTPSPSRVWVAPLATPDDARPVKVGDLLMPQVGNWSIVVETMAGDAILPTGEVKVRWEGSDLAGYVIRSAPDNGVYSGVVVGGKGGLGKPVKAQHFYNQVARDIVTSTLSQVGETLAADSTGLSGRISYPRRSIAASRCLDELCDVLGLVWRVKLDGTVWLGSYTWPASAATFTYEKPEPDELAAKVVPDLGQPLVEPGTTVVLDSAAGASTLERTPQKVGVSAYALDERSLRATFWLVDPAAETYTDDKLAPDRMHAGMSALALQALRGVDWYRTFGGVVVQQRSDGTLDVQLDRVRGVGEMPDVRGVAVSTVVGGAVRRVRQGERCTVAYDGGDFRLPRVLGFDSVSSGNGSTTLEVARRTDTVDRNANFVAWMAGIESALTAAKSPTSTPWTFGSTIATISSGSADLKLPPGTT